MKKRGRRKESNRRGWIDLGEAEPDEEARKPGEPALRFAGVTENRNHQRRSYCGADRAQEWRATSGREESGTRVSS